MLTSELPDSTASTDAVPPLPTRRAALLQRLADTPEWDLVVVGGGATGLGVAVDAAVRGLRVLLVEAHDFAHGTSSRSTKLLHGGVRYLAQGDFALVREALHERRTVLTNAPHLSQPLAFVVPVYRFGQQSYYGAGLLLYDLLAGAAGLGRTEFLSPAATLAQLPQARAEGLRGGVKYWDAQFDDARLALALARTAAVHGALVLNYCSASDLQYTEGRISGLTLTDTLNGESGGARYRVRTRCVVNATGVWVDALRAQDDCAVHAMVAPSQGVHIVLDRSFLASDAALMVPHTDDGRVLFIVPWLGKLIVGTTDTARHDLPREPQAREEEVDFLLREAGRYLRRAPTRADIKSIWVGLRPLVHQARDDGKASRALSRSHAIEVSRHGLVTVTGGKWTTYRAMAEDVLEQCVAHGVLPHGPRGLTRHLRLVGAAPQASPAVSVASVRPDLGAATGLWPQGCGYGTDLPAVSALPGAAHWLAPGLSEAMVRFAARHEYALRVEDVLARRSRLLFLDAALAHALAPQTGLILRQETGIDPRVEDFCTLATQYTQIPPKK